MISVRCHGHQVGREIHLLQVQPSLKNGQLCVNLTKASFNNGPKKIEWPDIGGNFKNFWWIQSSGQQAITPANLHVALQQFRARRPEMFFWTDTSCVDQADNAEKSPQSTTINELKALALMIFAWFIRNGLIFDHNREAARLPRPQRFSAQNSVQKRYSTQTTLNWQFGRLNGHIRTPNFRPRIVTMDGHTDKPPATVRHDRNTAVDTMQCQADHNTGSVIEKDAPRCSSCRNVAQVLDQSYQIQSSSFFVPGRSFAVVWREDLETTYGSKRTTDLSSAGRFDEKIYIRRMMIVKTGHGSCWGIPISLYGNRGVAKKAYQMPSNNTIRAVPSEISAHHHQHNAYSPTGTSSAGLENHESNITHKPQQPPPRMSPDDDDDDESYGFRRSYRLASDRHDELGSNKSGASERHSKKNVARCEQRNHDRPMIDHPVLLGWRSVIARICGPSSGCYGFCKAHTARNFEPRELDLSVSVQ